MIRILLIGLLVLLTACQPKPSEEVNKDNKSETIEVTDTEKTKAEKVDEKVEADEEKVQTDENDEPELEENLEMKGVIKEADYAKKSFTIETEDELQKINDGAGAIKVSVHNRTIELEDLKVGDEVVVYYMKLKGEIIPHRIKNLSDSRGSSVYIEINEKQNFEDQHQKLAYEALYEEESKFSHDPGSFLIIYPHIIDHYEDDKVLKLYTINDINRYILWDNNELESRSGALSMAVIVYDKEGDKLVYSGIEHSEDGARMADSVKEMVRDKPEIYEKYFEAYNTVGGRDKERVVGEFLDKLGYEYKLIENY